MSSRRDEQNSRRKQPERLAAPAKDHVHASTDELFAMRLNGLRLPTPSPTARERYRRTYEEWLDSAPQRNPWRR